MSSSHALLRLCQLVSPALPIGGFNFSQGLEYAIQAEWVRDEPSALAWIRGLANYAVGTLDVPVLLRLHAAWAQSAADAKASNIALSATCAPARDARTRIHRAGDMRAVQRWNSFLLAARETAELRAEDRHLGRALTKVLLDLKVAGAAQWAAHADCSFAATFAFAAVAWNIEANDAACGYLWSWAENQVLAAVKTVPLGQSAGQRMLDSLIQDIPHIAANAAALSDDEIGGAAPLHLIASAAHESQYTRLFHS